MNRMCSAPYEVSSRPRDEEDPINNRDGGGGDRDNFASEVVWTRLIIQTCNLEYYVSEKSVHG